ncbi:MAG: hypothetical protein Q8K82_00490 [Gemmatimonadaceae bacterium]|nr:hypothetical protein [Gemmatimonadaceae bacterium]
MMISLTFLVVLLVCVVVVPTVTVRVLRAFKGSAGGGDRRVATNQVDERLARMEEAIDAMAVQIDRLGAREERRYVSGGTSDAPKQTNPSDPPIRHDSSLARPGSWPPPA